MKNGFVRKMLVDERFRRETQFAKDSLKRDYKLREIDHVFRYTERLERLIVNCVAEKLGMEIDIRDIGEIKSIKGGLEIYNRDRELLFTFKESDMPRD